MANGQRIVVNIVGDDRSFQAALARSNAAAAKFGSSVNKSLGGGSGVSVAAQFDPLLERVRATRARADELSDRLKTLDGGFQDTAGGARQLSSGLLPMIGRVSLITFGVNAAYQASQHLADALKTTGNEAFTTSGKLRNFGSALLSGDLVGGIEALRAAPKTFDELGISVTRARNLLDGLNKVRLESVSEETRKLIESVKSTVAAADAAQNSADALADSYARLGTVFRDVTGQAVQFKGAVDDLGGPRGPGAVDQINAALELERAGKQGLPPQRPLGPASRRANALIVAQANEDLDEVLRLQTIQRDKLAKAIENSHGNVKQREELARNYALAVAAVVQTQRQIKAQNDAAKKAAQEAAAQDRSDMWNKIIGGLELGVDRARLTKGLGDDLARLEDLKAGLERQVKAGVDVASAQQQLVQVSGDIADKQQQIRDQLAAALQAKQFRELGLSSSGDEVIPSVANLAKRLKGVLARVDSGDLDIAGKLAAHLREAQKTIAKEGDALTNLTRAKINEFLKAATGQDSKLQGPLTRNSVFQANKIIEGLGLDERTVALIRQRVNAFNNADAFRTFKAPTTFATGTAGPVIVEAHTTVQLDGDVVGRAITRSQQKTARRNPVQKRGPNRNI